MRKMVLVLLIMFICLDARGAVVPTKSSGNTVLFGSIEWGKNGSSYPAQSPTCVTFNSVTKHIRLINFSKYYDCYADLKCRDANGKGGYVTTDSCVVFLPALGNASPNTVEIDYATDHIGFVGSIRQSQGNSRFPENGENSANRQVHYELFGDMGDF